MKTKKTNREEVRANSLTIPMTREEKNKIEKAAENRGLSMSAFARLVFYEYLKG